MRRELEIAGRAWARPVPALGLALAVGILLAGTWIDLTPYLATTRYVLALLVAALAVWVLGGLERATASRPTGEGDRILVLSSSGAALLAVFALQGVHGSWVEPTFGAASLLGCAHLAALAVVVRRIPWAPGPRSIAFVLLATAVPALVPTLRPLLDASPSFHDGHFPGWIAAFAPILTLAMFAVALPSPGRTSLAVESSA